MAEITMPKMSDTMEEGRIVRWLKHEGDQVTEGETIAEIETDKANVEMEAFEGGVVSQILVHEDETVPVGQPIALIAAPGTARPAEPSVEAEQVEQAQQVERVEQREQEEIEPEVSTTEIPEPCCTDQVPMATAPIPPEPESPSPGVAERAPTARPEEEERVMASPLARRMAEAHGIDLSRVQGTGPNGRIVESDIEKYLKSSEEAPTPQAQPQVPAPPRHAAAPLEGPVEEHDLSRMRATIAERMTRSKQTIPHFYVTTEIDMDWAARVRDELNAEENQPRISFTDMVIKAAAFALRRVPQANASFADGKLLMHQEVNIGMAVALDDGLMVPVIHNADSKSLREIAVQTKELAKRARENKLHATDYAGATFTVSNLGMFDAESFSAIINPPESASLAVGAIRDVPVVVDGQLAVGKRMKATISADHRVLDGAVAAKFLQEMKRRLESPIGVI